MYQWERNGNVCVSPFFFSPTNKPTNRPTTLPEAALHLSSVCSDLQKETCCLVQPHNMIMKTKPKHKKQQEKAGIINFATESESHSVCITVRKEGNRGKKQKSGASVKKRTKDRAFHVIAFRSLSFRFPYHGKASLTLFVWLPFSLFPRFLPTLSPLHDSGRFFPNRTRSLCCSFPPSFDRVHEWRTNPFNNVSSAAPAATTTRSWRW